MKGKLDAKPWAGPQCSAEDFFPLNHCFSKFPHHFHIFTLLLGYATEKILFLASSSDVLFKEAESIDILGGG